MVNVERLVKPLNLETLERLEEINKQGHDDSFTFKGAQNIFVAKDNFQIIGFAVLNRPHGYWYFRNCVVDKQYVGGVQRKLIEARLKYVEDQGGNRVSTLVNPQNYRSLNNLTSAGFKFKGMKRHNDSQYQLLEKRL